MSEPNNTLDFLLDLKNRDVIARVSNARLNPPEYNETTIIEEPRRCEDCTIILAEDYDGDICAVCVEIEKVKK